MALFSNLFKYDYNFSKLFVRNFFRCPPPSYSFSVRCLPLLAVSYSFGAPFNLPLLSGVGAHGLGDKPRLRCIWRKLPWQTEGFGKQKVDKPCCQDDNKS